MPCMTDGPATESEERAARARFTLAQIEQFEAVLCGILSSRQSKTGRKDLLDDVDWKEVGVSRAKVEHWFAAHTEKDRHRRKEEAARERRERAREAALAKLTPAERRLLKVR